MSRKSHDGIIERHPWDRFPCENYEATYLIIGSFPPSKFTREDKKMNEGDMEFFYGSKENAFWKLFIKAKKLDIDLPNELDKLKAWMRQHYWVVTDIVKEAKRFRDTALDNDLIVVKWNVDTIVDILNSNPIHTIFCTSNWVKKNFDRRIIPFLKKEYKIYTLLSPSPNGLRSAKKASFIHLKPMENESASAFRERYYIEVFRDSY